MTQVSDDLAVAAMAAVLANPTRLAILRRLSQAPCNVGELVQDLGLEQAVVSKQLRLLGDAGLLACRPDGRCRFYSTPRGGTLKRALTALAGLVEGAKKTREEKRNP